MHTNMHTYINMYTHAYMHKYIHTYIHAYIHTYIIHGSKMADEVTQSIEDVLNRMVKTTDQSGNMKKELKKNIYETVSTLKNLFIKMKAMLEEGTRQENQME